jgi:hypothetical protein
VLRCEVVRVVWEDSWYSGQRHHIGKTSCYANVYETPYDKGIGIVWLALETVKNMNKSVIFRCTQPPPHQIVLPFLWLTNISTPSFCLFLKI